MGFFSNVNIDQETDREQGAVRQTDEVPVTVEPTRLSTPADTAAQTPSASQEEVKKQAATETVQPTEDEKRKAHAGILSEVPGGETEADHESAKEQSG